jgi:hypothetical protein
MAAIPPGAAAGTYRQRTRQFWFRERESRLSLSRCIGHAKVKEAMLAVTGPMRAKR